MKLDPKSLEAMFDANRRLWDLRTRAHLESEFYGMPAFLQGKCSLNPFELDLLGDLTGQSVLHLQCHFGQDTLSLARRGAKVTGIDFSEQAIDVARQLAQELGLSAEFLCCNVYDTRSVWPGLADKVFTSYGTIGWLPDLDPWARVIDESLRPGGSFILVDFHPLVWTLDHDFTTFVHSYFNRDVIETQTSNSYADSRELHPPASEFGWNHALSEVLGALLERGLILDVFREHDESPYQCFPGMEMTESGMYVFTQWPHMLPLVYSLRMRKP